MLTNAVQVLEASPSFLIGCVFVLGLVVGSFLNVVIHRLPKRLEQDWKHECRLLLGQEAPDDEPRVSLVTPRSHCPHCGTPIRARDNVPLLSYLWLRGRCASCGAHISLRYPFVELLTGVVSAVTAWHFGFAPALAAALLLSWALIALVFIDLQHQILPDIITLPFLWLGLVLSLFGLFTDARASVIGASLGYLSLWSVYHAFRLLTGKEGMGYGDFKLLALFGAWLGWQMLPMIVLLASFSGAAVGLAMMGFGRLKTGVPIAFGPYLCAAGWLALVAGKPINHGYLHLFGLS